MSEIEGRIKKIEKQLGANDTEDSGLIDYGEYVRGVKAVLKKVEAGENLEKILERSGYTRKLRTELRKNIPRLIEKLKIENLWRGEKL